MENKLQIREQEQLQRQEEKSIWQMVKSIIKIVFYSLILLFIMFILFMQMLIPIIGPSVQEKALAQKQKEVIQRNTFTAPASWQKFTNSQSWFSMYIPDFMEMPEGFSISSDLGAVYLNKYYIQSLTNGEIPTEKYCQINIQYYLMEDDFFTNTMTWDLEDTKDSFEESTKLSCAPFEVLSPIEQEWITLSDGVSKAIKITCTREGMMNDGVDNCILYQIYNKGKSVHISIAYNSASSEKNIKALNAIIRTFQWSK